MRWAGVITARKHEAPCLWRCLDLDDIVAVVGLQTASRLQREPWATSAAAECVRPLPGVRRAPQPVAKQPHVPLPHLAASADAVAGRCACRDGVGVGWRQRNGGSGGLLSAQGGRCKQALHVLRHSRRSQAWQSGMRTWLGPVIGPYCHTIVLDWQVDRTSVPGPTGLASQ